MIISFISKGKRAVDTESSYQADHRLGGSQHARQITVRNYSTQSVLRFQHPHGTVDSHCAFFMLETLESSSTHSSDHVNSDMPQGFSELRLGDTF